MPLEWIVMEYEPPTPEQEARAARQRANARARCECGRFAKNGRTVLEMTGYQYYVDCAHCGTVALW